MNAPLNYPGVYSNEDMTNVRNIAGVDTSITAFIGSTLRGTENEPLLVQSFAGFQRAFGGVSRNHPMSYAVNQFFRNDGTKALVIRIVPNQGAAAATVTAGTLALVAANKGSWGNKLSVSISHPDPATSPNAEAEGLFNLVVTDAGTASIETFNDISSLPGSPRYAPLILEHQSSLVRTSGPLATEARPAEVSDIPFEPTGADGGPITDNQVSTGLNLETRREGLWALDKADLFNLLCIPPYRLDTGDIGASTRRAAAEYCLRRRAIFIADPLPGWNEPGDIMDPLTGLEGQDWGLHRNPNTALYFPRIVGFPDSPQEQASEFAPCGVIAGVIARTDATRAVWKAPAGVAARLQGISALSTSLTNRGNGLLNPLAVNCLRNIPGAGPVIWGARTLSGADQMGSQWKYLAVRRTALYIEESLYRGTSWSVFEPNDESLWSQIRLSVGAFLQDLYRQGAFQGETPRDAYFVNCDSQTTTRNDIINGVVNIVVGFAPLKPAEFIVIKIRQLTATA